MDQTAPLSVKDHIRKELHQENSSGSSSVKLVNLQLTALSDSSVYLLVNVERLSLRRNQLSSLPDSFINLKKLRYLDLNGNEFREIPPILYELPNLEILDLSQNKIKSLPHDVSLGKRWNKNLKILSLKNNRIQTINDILPFTKLESLSVLDIEGNYIPKEELDSVLSSSPQPSDIPPDEIWMNALRKFAASAIGSNTNNHHITNNSNSSKVKKASKRMGFINPSTSTPSSSENIIVPSSKSKDIPAEIATSSSNNNTTPSPMNNNTDLYNHSKFNDYFKRLSILPEESLETHKASHAEVVISCRKLLFSFTECQQGIRKIASFCKEKAVAVNVVSLLYSVRSHIDNLLELLEESENEENFNDQEMIKLCITILTIFKQLIGNLRKNFNTFFAEDDLCFIRMFYMTLLCSYNEIYNAWCFISNTSEMEAGQKLQQQQHIKSVSALSRKQTVKRNDSSVSLFSTTPTSNNGLVSTTSTSTLPSTTDINSNMSGTTIENIIQKPRVRSNTLQNKVLHSHPIESTRSFSNITNLTNGNTSLTHSHLSSATNNSSSNGQTLNVGVPYGQSPLSGSSTVSASSSASPVSISDNNNSSNMRNNVSDHKQKVAKSASLLSSQTPLSSQPQIPSEVTDTSVNSEVENGDGSDSVSSETVLKSRIPMNPSNSNNSSSSETSRTLSHSSNIIKTVNKHGGNGSVDEGDSKHDDGSDTQRNIDSQLYQMLTNVVKMVSVVYNQLTGEISKIAIASTNGQQVLTDSLSLKIKDLTDTCWQAMELSKSLNDRLRLLLSPDANITERYLSTVEKLKTWEKINAFLKSIISILGNTKVVMTDLPSLNEIRPNLASLAKTTKDVTVILDLSSYKSVSATAAQIQKQQQLQQQQAQQSQQPHQHHSQQQRQFPYQNQQQVNSHTHVPLLTPQPSISNPFDNLASTRE